MGQYTVEFECYHYNTGYADNCTYTQVVSFTNLDNARKFKRNLIEQREKEMELSELRMPLRSFLSWKENFGDKFYEVEDGFLSFTKHDPPKIFEVQTVKKEIQ